MELFDFLLEKVQQHRRCTMAVAVAQDSDVLSAVKMAIHYQLVDAILVGDQEQITLIAQDLNFDLNQVTIIDCKDVVQACTIAVGLVASQKAQILMKGLVDTSIILKAVLNKEQGLRTQSILSHVTVAKVPSLDRILLITDAAMNLYPDLGSKVAIINNAVQVAHSLGLTNPKVGVICAVEKVNPKMPCTLDAEQLSNMAKQGQISGCEVDGPFALDNAISVSAAQHKMMKTPNAGMIDILLMPNIEAGNILYKAMTFLAQGSAAGMIVGAKAPIVLTSRADSDQNKLVSIALSVIFASNL